jgi:hypothetical protein
MQGRAPAAFAADHVRGGEFLALGQHATERVEVATVDRGRQLDGDGIAVGQDQRWP